MKIRNTERERVQRNMIFIKLTTYGRLKQKYQIEIIKNMQTENVDNEQEGKRWQKMKQVL